MEDAEAVVVLIERYGDRDTFFTLNAFLSAPRLSRDLDLFQDADEAIAVSREMEVSIHTGSIGGVWPSIRDQS